MTLRVPDPTATGNANWPYSSLTLTEVSTLTFWTSPKLIGVGLGTFNCVPISTPEPNTNIRVNSVMGSV